MPRHRNNRTINFPSQLFIVILLTLAVRPSVSQTASVVKIAVSPAQATRKTPLVPFSSITVTAKVTTLAGQAVLDGLIEIRDGSEVQVTMSIPADGVVQFTKMYIRHGEHAFKAVYLGTATVAAGESDMVSLYMASTRSSWALSGYRAQELGGLMQIAHTVFVHAPRTPQPLMQECRKSQ